MTFFSAGKFCATAHQIRRYTGAADSHFFDWLVTPAESLDFFLKPTDRFLKSENWEIVGETLRPRIRLRDKYSDLQFQHEFPVIDEVVDPELVEGHLPAARSKYLYLREKTIEAMRAAVPCVIVRCENAISTVDAALLRIAQINRSFQPINESVRVVIVSARLTHELIEPNALVLRVSPSSRWQGDDASWDRVLSIAEKTFGNNR